MSMTIKNYLDFLGVTSLKLQGMHSNITLLVRSGSLIISLPHTVQVAFNLLTSQSYIVFHN